MIEAAEAQAVEPRHSEPRYVPTPTFAPPTSRDSARGHDERRLGGKLVYCFGCKERRPPGGWSRCCSKDARKFMGG